MKNNTYWRYIMSNEVNELNKDVKIKYGMAVVLSEEGNVIVKFLEGSEKSFTLQDGLGLIELAKLQLIGSVSRPANKEQSEATS
ncbi:MAG: hypothetical protein WC942_07130 [Clostridia bacterium]